MALKKSHGWRVLNEFTVTNGQAYINKNLVMGELVYILWPNGNEKQGQRICLGPFKSAEECEREYEKWLDGLVKKTTEVKA